MTHMRDPEDRLFSPIEIERVLRAVNDQMDGCGVMQRSEGYSTEWYVAEALNEVAVALGLSFDKERPPTAIEFAISAHSTLSAIVAAVGWPEFANTAYRALLHVNLAGNYLRLAIDYLLDLEGNPPFDRRLHPLDSEGNPLVWRDEASEAGVAR